VNVIGLVTIIFTTVAYWLLLMSTKSFAFTLLTSAALLSVGLSIAVAADTRKKKRLRRKTYYCVSLS
jgi:hypothetical protein